MHHCPSECSGGRCKFLIKLLGLQGYNWRNVLASFVHVHFGSCPALAAQLVERCAAVHVSSVSAAASAAAEAHAGPRSFPLDGGSFNSCNGVHRQRDYKSATVSPESVPGFPGASRPIFPVRALLLGPTSKTPCSGRISTDSACCSLNWSSCW